MARSVEQKRLPIEPDHPQLSVHQQCQLRDLQRSTLYYQPVHAAGKEDTRTLALMWRRDEQYTATPCYGVRRMTA